jgi:hypothetical protein
LEKTLEQKDYKRQFGEKLGMATLSSFIAFNICNILKNDLNIMGAFTKASSKGTEIIVSRFGFVESTHFYIEKKIFSKAEYFHEIFKLNKKHDLYMENNLANVTSENIITYYKKKDLYQYWAKKMSDRLFILNDSSIELLVFYTNKIIESINNLHNKEKEILFNKEITKLSDYYYILSDYYQQFFYTRIWGDKYHIILFFNETSYSRFERELERIKKIVKNCKAKFQKNEDLTLEQDEPKKRIRNENDDDTDSKRVRFTAKCSFCYKKNPKYTEKGSVIVNYFCNNRCQNNFYKQ